MPLTEDDVVAIIEDLSKAGTAPALKKIAAERINSARMNDAQRERLAKAYGGQLEEINRAIAAERAAAAKDEGGPAR